MQLGDVGMQKAAESLQGRQFWAAEPCAHPALSALGRQLRESSAD